MGVPTLLAVGFEMKSIPGFSKAAAIMTTAWRERRVTGHLAGPHSTISLFQSCSIVRQQKQKICE